MKITKKGYLQNYGEEFLKSLFYLRNGKIVKLGLISTTNLPIKVKYSKSEAAFDCQNVPKLMLQFIILSYDADV